MHNFFELLNQPQCFLLNLEVLETSLIEAQKRFHPDNLPQGTQMSAQINQAYMTLKDPFKRAVYLLLINGIDVASEVSEPLSAEFLMQQMEFREQLEETGVRDTIQAEISARYTKLEKLLKDINQTNLELAANVLKELRFFSSLTKK